MITLPKGWDQHKTEVESWLDELERNQWKTDVACTLIAVGAFVAMVAAIVGVSWLAWWMS